MPHAPRIPTVGTDQRAQTRIIVLFVSGVGVVVPKRALTENGPNPATVCGTSTFASVIVLVNVSERRQCMYHR